MRARAPAGVGLLDAAALFPLEEPEPRRLRCPYSIPIAKVKPGATVEVVAACTFERFTPDRVVIHPGRGSDLSAVTFDAFATGNGCDGFGRIPIVLGGHAVDYRHDAVPAPIGHVEITPALGDVRFVFRNGGAAAVDVMAALIGWAVLK
jgi:hypothetical protein